MPTIDGGHIYLTCLVPLKQGGEMGSDGQFRPWSHRLREELALLPTAQQSPETVNAGLVSPFARCLRTHFLRLAVIDQPMWNGRDPVDPLLNILLRRKLKEQPPFDVLSRPFLLLAADIDRAPHLPGEGLEAWAAALWTRSEAEVRAIFASCYGFEGVADARGFARWLLACQVPTTMSFNGYYDGVPELKGVNLKALLGLALAIAGGVTALAALLVSGWWLVLAFLLGLGLGLSGVFRRIARLGAAPFPPFPDSDLPSVLKALWLQQRFGRFAEAHQGDDPAKLHAAFGAFLAATRPADLSQDVSQPPGVVRSDDVPLPEPERQAYGAFQS